jgi:dihydrodipicolinate reductase
MRLSPTRYTTAVTEIHHTKKLDAPSGTAKILAGALKTTQVRVGAGRMDSD